ncbi:hypothetical protein [Salibacterium salarium]|nr:hypothetical protein [Salibacterium salarium]
MKVDAAIYFKGQKYPQELIEARQQYLLDLFTEKQKQFLQHEEVVRQP